MKSVAPLLTPFLCCGLERIRNRSSYRLWAELPGEVEDRGGRAENKALWTVRKSEGGGSPAYGSTPDS